MSIKVTSARSRGKTKAGIPNTTSTVIDKSHHRLVSRSSSLFGRAVADSTAGLVATLNLGGRRSWAGRYCPAHARNRSLDHIKTGDFEARPFRPARSATVRDQAQGMGAPAAPISKRTGEIGCRCARDGTKVQEES